MPGPCTVVPKELNHSYVQAVNGNIPPTDRVTDPPKQASRLTGELIMIGDGFGI